MTSVISRGAWLFSAYFAVSFVASECFHVADALIFRGSRTAVQDGITYEMHWGISANTISNSAFSCLLVALLCSLVAIPLMAVAERRAIIGRRFYVFAGFSTAAFAQSVSFAMTAKLAPGLLVSLSGNGIFDSMLAKSIIDLALALLFGCLGGLAYWAIAGRYSGTWKAAR